ncbi:hypothetical protein AK830_g3309 [Neonectria ditissima]|uniref:Uncharacterized protein n=1 Tax=Neonectria ditissima TaxID=78410 RepID=A0A0P7BS32_9HYPO|nr:hypothetical protein AK830_g3309 [Neonectria ditissima]
MGCLISMEYIGGQQDTGSFLIKLIHYDDSSFAAGAGFRFPLLQTLKVSHFIRIFQGMDGRLPVEHQSDLTHYNFVVADYATMSVDGCRDIVTQWMIRLHTMGVVGWVADAQTVPGIVFDWTLNSWAFQDLIGNNYKFSGRSDGDRQRIVNVTYLPLDRGVFPDPRVRRIETYGRVRLPYNPPAY